MPHPPSAIMASRSSVTSLCVADVTISSLVKLVDLYLRDGLPIRMSLGILEAREDMAAAKS